MDDMTISPLLISVNLILMTGKDNNKTIKVIFSIMETEKNFK